MKNSKMQDASYKQFNQRLAFSVQRIDSFTLKRPEGA